MVDSQMIPRMAAALGAFLTLGALGAQKPGDNLVPNPGFEEFGEEPSGWYYKGKDFNRVMRAWSSPTGTSPDAYGPGVEVPGSWADKGFGRERPHGGKAMAGITVYGCEDGKPHCREYLQVKLKEPLVYGQLYELSFWVRKLPRSGAVDRLGATFSYRAHAGVESDPLSLDPVWECRKPVGAWSDRWQRIVDTVRATGEERFLILGNFRSDSLTAFRASRKDPLPFSYYYIDDVSLVKKPPYLVATVQPEDLADLRPEEGMLVRLKDIHFESGKADILTSSEVELQKLLGLLKAYPRMAIRIVGHTDHQGGDEYNLELSKRRAHAVADYLKAEGIAAERLEWSGRGSRQPAATNASAEGRRINRRVEFLVLRM